ncbi:hypothetical protein KCG48_04435 [Proteiniclasticum sp. BAD-10]|uniref:Membrane protein involved in the export of O-antigen and teichoic acid n=1 Tax=Proteiniclasticum sediminis TaxID=2804028 RepID=A0A941CMU7_9CLOT|nr:hypothetical protein [Proteiniclasticum sediminis]MBR0575585.1 hypothetical protein [Proteiniclasticum sediminis]
MNNKALNFLKNFSYTIVSNVISLVISTLVVLVIPKLLGIEQYGYWQLYFFYSAYVGFLHFGWVDGIYLRYGGKTYEELDKVKFFSQFHMLSFSQIVLAILVVVGTLIFPMEGDRQFIFQMTAICLVLSNIRYMLIFILQGTARIKEYSAITILDRLIYVVLIVGFLLAGSRDYKVMIYADLLGKAISLGYAMVTCKEMVFRKVSEFTWTVKEMLHNIQVGIKLMISNIAGSLIVGIVRFGVERVWNVVTFAKVSLSLTISNLLMLFINAVGIIMYPLLRRTEEKKLPELYGIIRTLLLAMMLGLLVFYFPLKAVLLKWLPNYAESLHYMPLVFPLSVYEGQMSLLTNTYLKTLRQEKLMLKLNVTTMALSGIATLITTVMLKNLDLAMASITILLVIRSFLAERQLAKLLKVDFLSAARGEFLVILVFMVSGWFLESVVALVPYLLAYGVYLFLQRERIAGSFKRIKGMLRA